MTRKAEQERRPPRRRPLPTAAVAEPAPRKAPQPAADDSDFGLALALGPAMRRRPDA
jgi:hypothetical protein